MAKLTIQNRQKRTHIIPASADGQFPAITIEPGDSATIDKQHFDAIRKGNVAMEYLLTNRHLVANPKNDVSADELVNPAGPVAPSDISEPVEGVKVEKTVDVKEVKIDDAPAEVKVK